MSSLFRLSLTLLFWGITKTEFGARVIALPPSFVVTLFVSWSASRWKNVVLFDKAIVRINFVIRFSLRRRLLSLVLLLGALKLIPRNTGSSLKHFMASVVVRGTGTTKSMLFFFPLVLPLLWKTLAFTPVSSLIQKTHPTVLPNILSRWGFTLTTLLTSLKIPPSNPCFAAS